MRRQIRRFIENVITWTLFIILLVLIISIFVGKFPPFP